MIKTIEEIEKLKKSSQLADDCYNYIVKEIKLGMTEKQVAEMMEKYMLDHGASKVSFELIVGSGPNSGTIHSKPTDRVLNYEDLVQLDFGCILDGYCSDCSRVLFMGKVKPKYKEIYDIVYEAQKAGIENTKEGMTAKEVDSICRDIIKSYGYDFNHAVGHGVGVEVHEEPTISPKVEDVKIENNMVITIEPGIYFENEFGIRIEDTCVMVDGKLEPLNKTTKEIVVINN